MKHFAIFILIITTVLVCIFLPYSPGEYDYFTVALSSIFQFSVFPSLLFIPIGIVWGMLDGVEGRRTNSASKHVIYLKNLSLAILVLIMLAAALGATVLNSNLLGIIILMLAAFVFVKISKKTRSLNTNPVKKIIPYYLIFVPLTLFLIRNAFIEKAKNWSTSYVIAQSGVLVNDIESYKNKYGHYPLSIQSTIEDYKPSIRGVKRFQYEQSGRAYNLYFEQFSDMVGTEEIVMYNKLDEQQMTVHNEDLLRIPSEQIIRGYHLTGNLNEPHWKYFLFD